MCPSSDRREPTEPVRVIAGSVRVSEQQLKWMQENDEATGKAYRVPYWQVSSWPKPRWRDRPIWRLRAWWWSHT